MHVITTTWRASCFNRYLITFNYNLNFFLSMLITSRISVMLISAIFMKQLPLEFSSVLGKLLPALTGGSNLMLMGVYSYLTEMTAEKDRTFRFGIFAVFVPLIPIASVPFSGILFQKLRYISINTNLCY